MRLSDLTTVINACLNASVAPCLYSNPGNGKSEYVKNYAKEIGYDFIHLNCHTLESTDLVLPAITGDSVDFLPCAWVKKALQAKKPVLIFLDEVNRTRIENVNLLTTLVLEKEVYGHRLPITTKFIAAANFNSNCTSTLKLDAAIMARFCHLLFDIPFTDSLPFMGSKYAQEFLLSVADLVKEPSQESDFQNDVLEELQVNRRSLTWCVKLFEDKTLDSSQRRMVAQGFLGLAEGSKFAAAYEAFSSEQARKVPTKIKGNEERLGELLAQGMVGEVCAVVQASIDKGDDTKMDALLFLLSYGNPESVRNIILNNKGITATIIKAKDIKNLKLTKNLDKVPTVDTSFCRLLGLHTDLIATKEGTNA